ncbi:cation efflux transmembrane transport protein, putative, partial [Bodo saltans]
MATVGFGDIPPQDDNERKFLMLLIVIGWLFNAYIIGSLVGFFQTSDIETERQGKLLELSTLLEHFEVPPSLMLEILSFEDYLLANSIKKSFGHIVNDLPLDMQRNVELWNRVKVINSIPFFQVFHKSAKLQICNVLVEITFCPEDYVYMIGELGTEMFFVNHGFVDILDHNSDLVVTKKAGDSFGEIGAFAMESIFRSEDAKCLTYCEFFVLAKEPLMEVRQRYPRVQRQVEDYCEHGREVEMNKLDLAMSVRYVSGYNTSSTNIAAEGGCGVFIQRRESTGGDGADKWGGGGGGNELAQLKSEILPDGQFGLGLFSEESAPSLSPPRNETATGLSGFAITTATSTSVQCKRPPPIYIGIDVEEFTVGPIIRSNNNNKKDDAGGEGDDVVVVGGFVTSGPQETSAYSIDKYGREEEEGDDSDGGRELQQLDDSTPERRSRGRDGGGDGSGAGADARLNSGASLLLFSSVSPGTNAIPPPPPMAASQQQQLQQQQQQHSTSPSLPSSSGLVQATVQKTASGSFTSLPGVSVVVAAAIIPNAPPLQQQQQQAATTRRGTTTTPPSRDLSVVIPPQTPPRTPLHHSLSVSAMRKQSSSSQLYAVAHQQQPQQQLRHSFDATPPSQHLQVPTGRSPSTSQNFQQQPQQPAKQQQSRHHPPKQPRHQQVLVPIALDMLNEDLMIQSQTSGGCDSSHQSLSPFIPPLEQQPTTAADLNFATTNHGGGSHIKSPMHQQRQHSGDFYFSLNQHGNLNNTSATSFLTTASGGGGGGVGGKRQQQQQAPQRPLTPKMLHSPMLAYPRSSPQSDLYQRQVSQHSSGGSVVGGAAAGGGGAATTAVARKFAKSPLTSALIPVGPPPMLLGISATTPTTGAHHRPTRFGEVSTSQLFPLAAVESNNTPLHHGVAATAALGSGGGGGGLYNFGTNNNDATIIDTGGDGTTGDGTGTTNNNTGEEWNGVRGEVGRLAHSALVELVMQYLCDGMAINELLQQQQQQQKG